MTNQGSKQRDVPATTLTEQEVLDAKKANLEAERKRLDILQRGADLGGYKGVVRAVFDKLVVVARHNANPFAHAGGAAKEWGEIADLIELAIGIEEAQKS